MVRSEGVLLVWVERRGCGVEERGEMRGDALGARLEEVLVCRRVRRCCCGEESRGADALNSEEASFRAEASMW